MGGGGLVRLVLPTLGQAELPSQMEQLFLFLVLSCRLMKQRPDQTAGTEVQDGH